MKFETNIEERNRKSLFALEIMFRDISCQRYSEDIREKEQRRRRVIKEILKRVV